MFVLRAASAAACTAVNGGAITISTSATSLTTPRSSLTNADVSCTVLNIFQLPAINGIRMSDIRQGRHARQRATAQKLERCAASGGNVGNAIGETGLLYGRDRIAAADDRGAV